MDLELPRVSRREGAWGGWAGGRALLGINQPGTEDEEGLDSDVINPPGLQEVCQCRESSQSFQRIGWI